MSIIDPAPIGTVVFEDEREHLLLPPDDLTFSGEMSPQTIRFDLGIAFIGGLYALGRL